MSLDEGPQTHRGVTLVRFDAVKNETEDVPLESGAAARSNNMADEKDPDEQEAKS